MPFKYFLFTFWRDIIQVDRQLDFFTWGWVVVPFFLITCKHSWPVSALVSPPFLSLLFLGLFFWIYSPLEPTISSLGLVELLPAIESAKKFFTPSGTSASCITFSYSQALPQIYILQFALDSSMRTDGGVSKYSP